MNARCFECLDKIEERFYKQDNGMQGLKHVCPECGDVKLKRLKGLEMILGVTKEAASKIESGGPLFIGVCVRDFIKRLNVRLSHERAA